MGRNFLWVSISLLSLSFCGGGGEIITTAEKSAVRYSVSVTVKGLKGVLVIENNFRDQLEIKSNGEYTFAEGLRDGAQYNVQVVSRPASQVCTAAKNTGNIRSASVSGIEIICRDGWLPFPGLSEFISPGGKLATLPSVVMDGKGNGVISWFGFDSADNLRVYMAELQEGIWEDPTSLDDHISTESKLSVYFLLQGPQMAMNEAGDVVIVWSQNNGIEDGIFLKEKRAGLWKNTVKISPSGSDAFTPSVDMNATGDTVVAWSQLTSSGFASPMRAEYRGGVWNTPKSKDSYFFGGSAFVVAPRVAINDVGEAMITWSQVDGSGSLQVFVSHYKNGSWVDPSSISDNLSPDGSDAFFPQVAMDNLGNAVIAWSQTDNSTNTALVFKADYRGAKWITPLFEDSVSAVGTSAINVNVEMADNGYAAIVWDQDAPSKIRQIHFAEYVNGLWTPPTSTESPSLPTSDASNGQLSLNSKGDALLVWRQSDGLHEQLFKAERRDGFWTYPQNIDDNISANSTSVGFADCAIDNTGNAIIVWDQLSNEIPALDQIYRAEFK